MYPDQVILLVLRKTLLLALVGGGFVLLGGLLLPLIEMVIIAALVGVFVWLPLRSLWAGDKRGGRSWWLRARVYRADAQICGADVRDRIQQIWSDTRTWIGRICTLVVEVASGSAVGALLMYLRPAGTTPEVLLGAAAGAGLGALIGLRHWQGGWCHEASGTVPPDLLPALQPTVDHNEHSAKG